MKALDQIVSKIELYLIVFTSTIMLLLTFANVCSRFVFNYSLAFSEEITLGLFVLSSLLGASAGVKKKTHLGLSILTDVMNEKRQQAFRILADLLSLGMSVGFLYYGVQMVISEIELEQVTAAMQWPEWIFGMALPVGFGLLSIRFFLDLSRNVRGGSEE